MAYDPNFAAQGYFQPWVQPAGAPSWGQEPRPVSWGGTQGAGSLGQQWHEQYGWNPRQAEIYGLGNVSAQQAASNPIFNHAVNYMTGQIQPGMQGYEIGAYFGPQLMGAPSVVTTGAKLSFNDQLVQELSQTNPQFRDQYQKLVDIGENPFIFGADQGLQHIFLQSGNGPSQTYLDEQGNMKYPHTPGYGGRYAFDQYSGTMYELGHKPQMVSEGTGAAFKTAGYSFYKGNPINVDINIRWGQSDVGKDKLAVLQTLSTAMDEGLLTQADMDIIGQGGGQIPSSIEFQKWFGDVPDKWISERRAGQAQTMPMAGVGAMPQSTERAWQGYQDGKVSLRELYSQSHISGSDYAILEPFESGYHTERMNEGIAKSVSGVETQFKDKYPDAFAQSPQDFWLGYLKQTGDEILNTIVPQEVGTNTIPLLLLRLTAGQVVVGADIGNILLSKLSNIAGATVYGQHEKLLDLTQLQNDLIQSGVPLESGTVLLGRDVTPEQQQKYMAVVDAHTKPFSQTMTQFQDLPWYAQLAYETIGTLPLLLVGGGEGAVIKKSLTPIAKGTEPTLLNTVRELSMGVNELKVLESLRQSVGGLESLNVLKAAKERIVLNETLEAVSEKVINQNKYLQAQQIIDFLTKKKPVKIPADVQNFFNLAEGDYIRSNRALEQKATELNNMIGENLMNNIPVETRAKMAAVTKELHPQSQIFNGSEILKYDPLKFDELEPLMFTPDKLGEAMQVSAKMPIVRQVLQGFNPNLVNQESRVMRGAALERFGEAQNSSTSNNIMNRMYGLLEGGKPLFNIDKQGIVKNVQITKGGNKFDGHYMDVLEFPEKYKFTDGTLVSDHPWVKSLYSNLDYQLKLMRNAGVEVSEVKLQPGQKYIHRAMTEYLGEDLSNNKGIRNLTKSELFMTERKFATAKDALNSGYKFNNDYEQVIRDMFRSRLNQITKQQFADYVKPLGTNKLPTMLDQKAEAIKQDLNYMMKSFAKLQTTSKVSINKISTISPELATAISQNRSVPELQRIANTETQRLHTDLARVQAQKEEIGKLYALKNAPMLEGYKFERDIRDKIQDVIQRKRIPGVTEGLGTAKFLNAVMKMCMTAADFGVYGTYGTMYALFNPKATGQAFLNSVKALNKSSYRQVIANLAPDIQHSIQVGRMSYMSPEFAEFAGYKIPHKALGGVLDMFSRNMGTFIDTFKVQSWKSMYRPEMTAKEAYDLGNTIEKVSLTLNQARLGMSPLQRDVESGLLLYASSYTRSAWGLVCDLFKFNKTSLQAARALGGALALPTMATVAIGEIMKVPYNIDPAKAHYLQVKVGDYWYGASGPTVSIARMFTDAAQQAVEDPAQLFSPRDSAVVQYAQGKSSALLGMVTDFVKGKNFVGDPLYGKDANETMKLIARNELSSRFNPMWSKPLWDLPEGIDGAQVAAATMVEFLGGRTSTESPYQILNGYVKDKYGAESYSKMGIKAKKDAYDTDPALRELVAKTEAYTYGRKSFGGMGVAEENKYLDAAHERIAINNTFSSKMHELEDKRKVGAVGYADWKVAIKEIEKARNDQFSLWEQQYPDIYKNMTYEKDLSNSSYAEILYYEYTKEVSSGRFDLPDGEFNYKAYQEYKNKCKAEWGDNWDQVQIIYRSGKNLPPFYVNYQLAKDEIGMSGYWDLPRDKDPQTGVNIARSQFLEQNPKIDALLYVWRYSYGLQTTQAADIAKATIKTIGMIDRPIPVPMDTIKYKEQRLYYDNLLTQTYNQARGTPRSVALNDVDKAYKQITSGITSTTKVTGLFNQPDEKAIMTAQYQKLEQLKGMVPGNEPWSNYMRTKIEHSMLSLWGRINRVTEY
ncbi:MAG: hypothetical protein IMZ61_06395 [Planctomycetes bacterium]|nr:hypothetical protein [Thermoplasmata archaeon]MBE3143536.1 hypothetical protein [Planctomycetota bacterium]